LNLQRRNYTWRIFPPLPDRPAGQYGFSWSSERIKQVFEHPLYRELVSSAAFRRLADIRFLGAIDYFVHPTGKQFTRRRHTRLEHTLGVAHLALIYSRLLNLSTPEETLVVSAALLHDIGHAPLSHSIESAFKRHFGINHHLAGTKIILADLPTHRKALEVQSILEKFGIDVQEVILLIAGKHQHSRHNFLFSHPINIDTLEAISRSETYFKATPTSPTPDIVLSSLIRRNQPRKLDEFWALKDRVYNLLIQGPLGLYADYVALQYVEKNIDAFSADDFFTNERGLRKKHPELFFYLADARKSLIQNDSPLDFPVEFSAKLRRFYIDESFDPGEPNRYKQKSMSVAVAFAGLRQMAVQQLQKSKGSEFKLKKNQTMNWVRSVIGLTKQTHETP
jgi:uncharacterized protein